MAAAPLNFPNAGHFYSNVAKPIEIDLNFIVDRANGNGLGIRSLKSNGYVKNVYMQSSSTPASGNPMVNSTSAGLCLVQLQGNFNHYLGGFQGFVSQNATSTKIDNGATLTIGHAYVIATVGNATAAQWTTVGVPAGVTPAVGLSFIAKATGAGSGNTSTSRVVIPGVTGITSVEVIGDASQSINSNTAANGGMYLLIQFLGATDASTTTLIPTAPQDNAVVGMTIKLDASSVSVDGL